MPLLVLTRRLEEAIRITCPDGQIIRVVPVNVPASKRVRLSVNAPAEIRVDREEIAVLRDQERIAAEERKIRPTADHLVCPHCDAALVEDSQYRFFDVREDPGGRDVLAFRCGQCGKVGESFVYCGRPAGVSGGE